MSKKLSFKYKFRLIFVILFLVLMNLGIKTINMPVYLNYNNTEIVDETTNSYIEVYVASGDTIWNIVERNYDKIDKPNYIELRDVISIVIDLNDGSNIKNGDVIKIPAVIN